MEYTISLRIKIRDIWEDKSQYVQLPISITNTLDESLDLGEVVLNFTPDSEEYEAYSDVDFQITIDGITKSYFMVVQKDAIEEQMIGTRSYYKHKLTLIEGTQKMSTVIVNDFSVTQPLSAVLGYTPAIRESDTLSTSNMTANSTFSTFWSKTFREVGGAVKDSAELVKVSGSVADPWEVYYSAVYDFQLNIGNYDIKQNYSAVDKYIPLPSQPSGTFKFGAMKTGGFLTLNSTYLNNMLTSDIVFGGSIYPVYKQFNLNVKEELFDITNPLSPIDKTSLIEGRRIAVSDLEIGHTYQIVVRTTNRLDDGEAYWEHPDNTFSSNVYMPRYNTIGVVTSVVEKDILSLLNRPAGTTHTVITAVSFTGTTTTTDTVEATENDEIFRYTYSFSVSATSTLEDQYSVYDVIKKAIDHIEPRKLLDSRFYKQTTDPELVGLSIPISVPNEAAKSLPYIYIPGDISDKAIGTVYRLYYPTFADAVFYVVDSTITEALIDINDYDTNFNSGVYYTKKLRFSISPELQQKTIRIPALDFTFAGGKNLLEVMFEVGKLFDGIPRLLLQADSSYLISFDILDDLPDNELFDDNTGLFVKESSTDNYATGLISQIENAMVDDEDVNRTSNTSFYPSSNAWVGFRTESFEDTVLKLIGGESTSEPVIAIDDPNIGIYKLIDIRVRNVNSNTSSGGVDYLTGISIKDFVVEKSIFDTLPLTPAAKGKVMYYEKDKNKIYNAMKIYDPDSVLGFTGTTRVLQDILTALGYTPDNTAYPFLKYEFKIEYIPTILKTRVVSEQSTLTKESTEVYNAYSQSERNISLAQYGQTADRILKRSGINNINKVYMITNPRSIPVIGERINSGGYPYYADSITTIFHNNHIQCAVSYSKNINKINKFVGFNKNYREYSIFKDDVVWKRMNINNYAYIDTQAYTTNVFDPKKLDFYRSIRAIFTHDEATLQKLESAVYVVKTLDGVRETRGRDTDFDGDIDTYDTLDPIITKLVGSYSNNSLMFTSAMFDNFSGGRTLTTLTNTVTGGVTTNRRGQLDVPYCDENGRAEVLELMFLNSAYSSSDPDVYPKLPEADLPSKRTNSKFKETFFVNKDNRDALQMIYQLHFQSRNKDIEPKSALVRFNRLVSANLESQVGKIVAVGIEDIDAIRNKRVYNYDSADILNPAYYSTPSINTTTGVMSIPGFSFTSTKNYEGYAWVFENTGDIALIHTLPIAAGSATIPTIYFNFTEERLGAVQQ